WMSNTAITTEVISVGTGELTFGSSLITGSGSGTLNVSGAGIVNFNGSSSPSFSFGGATAPSFTTTNGCTLNFANGLTNSNSTLTLAATSQSIFSGSGTIPPHAFITFGHFQSNSGSAIDLAGNIAVAGNWTN